MRAVAPFLGPEPVLTVTSAETSLYLPVKAFLERLGFTVKGEVRGCDVVAVRPGEPPLVVITELKLGFSMELLLQAVQRMPSADEVWLAVPATRRGRDRDPRALRLCRLLGVGLLAVDIRHDHVAILVEAGPYQPRPSGKKRGLLLQEFNRRRGDPATGGSSRQPIMTAYRQRALLCADALRAGPQPTSALRGRAPDAARLLHADFYGWFERIARGVYSLKAAGHAALAVYDDELRACVAALVLTGASMEIATDDRAAGSVKQRDCAKVSRRAGRTRSAQE